ncbi:winged helix-turn-helix transcriptional regulator [Janthinobacterium agaricidamnosum]|uniref:HxlR-like helix-turn-helix family protein n=1 Tax=Janthinobacterium agaricidamnosum NBRC 102515 = DSM 9628 TaxID=1349767 RepID=W0V1H4_9BURK|nr:helix-turn-helix domain-containing protein [Janthinobacterium agaricidamnosum]CDG82679.1 hxlR-like helix-turn-helix family protein [Janthinobacterium agaricidamnosum NBRC 102515 = DSM 9628]
MSITKQFPGSPIERALGVISGRGKMLLIYVLLEGPKRIAEFEQQIPGLSQKVLIQQLRQLEEHGLINRQRCDDAPRRVEYVLTPLGLSLKPMIASLYEWGQQHAHELGEGEMLLPFGMIVYRPGTAIH